MKTRWNRHLKTRAGAVLMFNHFCMNHFVPCQSYLAVKEPFECAEQQALVGHLTFLGTTHRIFSQAKTHCSLLFWTLPDAWQCKNNTLCQRVLMACYVIYLKLSIDAQLVLEPFQFVIVQLWLLIVFKWLHFQLEISAV